jgi:hypothetical protein
MQTNSMAVYYVYDINAHWVLDCQSYEQHHNLAGDTNNDKRGACDNPLSTYSALFGAKVCVLVRKNLLGLLAIVDPTTRPCLCAH